MTVEWNGDKFLAKIDQRIERALDLAALEIKRQAEKNLSQSPPPGPDGDFPHRGFTRVLSRGIFIGDKEKGVRRIGAAKKIPYAYIQEVGGVINGKNGKRLAVPISPEAQKASAMGIGPRQFPRPLELVARPGKPALLVERHDKKGQRNKRSIIHYVLVRSVRLPARPYMRPTLVQCMPKIKEIFEKVVGGQ